MVCCDDESVYGESHRFCEESSEDIAEVSAGYGEADGFLGSSNFESCVDVVDDLCEDSPPIYGVDGGQGCVMLGGDILEFWHGEQ